MTLYRYPSYNNQNIQPINPLKLPTDKKMMKSVQSQKIHQTIQLLLSSFNQKQQFMKQNIPIQEQIMKKMQQTAELTLYAIANVDIVLREERNAINNLCESYERGGLHNRERFKLNQKKNPNQEFNQQDWNRNITRVLEGMSIAHISRTNSFKNYLKILDSCLAEVSKEEARYRSQIKASFKQLNNLFQTIDANQKQENKILAKLVKDSKNKQLKQSIFYLTQVKKAQSLLIKQVQAYIQRGKKILQMVKIVVKNEKKVSKRLKQLLTALFEKKKDLLKPSAQDQKILGLLTVLEDGVQQARQLYLQKTLVSKQVQQKISRLVQPQKSRVHHLMKYLSIDMPYLQKTNSFFNQIKTMSTHLSFKNFVGVSLAQGWIITSFTPCQLFLTFDQFLIIFDMNGNMLKKIQSSSTKVNKVLENVIFLEETKKGFFSDSKEEYQLKFDNSDRMEQFILFIQNQIA